MAMDANENTLSKKEIDEFIRRHYKPDDDSSPSFLAAIGGLSYFCRGKDMLQLRRKGVDCSICLIKFALKSS